ncbi:MAG TPA: outer membrane beta-barrel protein [Candidatus Acidoferrum sp.]|nr:outer membrane beta-barrel protein [Candidatus Acidoferrum sp.]
MLRRYSWLLLGLGWLLASAPAQAQGFLQKWEVTPFVGYETSGSYPVNPTSATVAVTNARANAAVNFGTFVDYSLTENAQFDFMWNRNPTSYSELVPPNPGYVKAYNSSIDQYQFGLLYMLMDSEHKWRPYIAGGVGFTHEFNSGQTPNRTAFAYSIGGGLKYALMSHISLRGEARYLPTYANSSLGTFCDPFFGCYTAKIHNYQSRGMFVAGVDFHF